MTRVLYVIGSLEIGGAELHLTRLAMGLQDHGFKPLIVSLSDNGPLKERLSARNIPVVSPPSAQWYVGGWLPRGIRRVLAALRSFHFLCKTLVAQKPEVVHFFLPAAYILGALAAIVTKTAPRVMSRRSLNHYQRRFPFARWVERRLHRHMHSVCANSQAVFSQLISEGVSLDRLRLIYNGINASTYNFAPKQRLTQRHRLGIAPETVAIVCVANLIGYKGHRDLLDALGLLQRWGITNWACFCVGRDDGLGADLRARAEALKISEKIHWTGAQADILPFLAASDIGTLCSHEEGFSNFVLEGMAAGLAMVVTNVGGNPEAIVNNTSGMVVPAQAPESIAVALRRLITDPACRAQLGQAARDRVLAHFSQEECIRSYVALYRDILRG